MTPDVSTRTEALADFPARYARTARFSTGAPRNLTVVAGGAMVLFCRAESADDAVLGLWSLDVATGAERLVVDPRSLGTDDSSLPAAERARRERARESGSGIVSFATDRSGRRACFALAGSLFVVDLASGDVTAPEVPGTVFDPRLDPAGEQVAYVDGDRLRVMAVATDGSITEVLVVEDTSPTVGVGRADFVAAEEMGRSRGFWWSPDGTHLAVARVDESPVDEWWIADPAHPHRAPNPVRYPAAGTANATTALEVVDVASGASVAVAWDDDGRFEYLADVVWQAGHPPLVVRQTRDQRLVSMAEVDTASGAVAEIRAISHDVWVDLVAGTPRWTSAGLATVEPVDGEQRLVVDGVPTASGNVRSVLGVTSTGDDTGDAHVLVAGWGEPDEVHLRLVPVGAAASAPIAVTTEPGVHHGQAAGSTLVVVRSSPEEPGAEATVRTVADGELTTVATIADHSPDPGFRADPFFVRLGADELTSALFLPADHDGERPLPVLLDPYGGPHAQRVLKAHNPHLVSRWLAEQGYAVLVTDGRGTPGRGPDWERAVWGNLADPVLDDQIAALDAVLDAHPFLDADRVGIRGWSFGGYLAALAVLRRPDRVHAAVAGAPVTTWRLYDTHYTERYLGHPATDTQHYDQSDLWIEGQPVSLDRPLLLIHGLADDNVVAAHTLRFSTELLAAGATHEVLPLSGVTHMTPQVSVAENLLRLQLDFFTRHLS
ncbi:MAG: prolyl oligopeptidase family serine peptidase [Actinomycetota bacterium]